MGPPDWIQRAGIPKCCQRNRRRSPDACLLILQRLNQWQCGSLIADVTKRLRCKLAYSTITAAEVVDKSIDAISIPQDSETTDSPHAIRIRVVVKCLPEGWDARWIVDSSKRYRRKTSYRRIAILNEDPTDWLNRPGVSKFTKTID
jgi:hypothetical protein